MPVTHNTIAIIQVHQILQGAREQGRDIDDILRRSGISPALLESPLSRVSQTQYTALVRTLTRVTRDEFWGLCSQPVPIGTFAPNCRSLVHCCGDISACAVRKVPQNWRNLFCSRG